MKSGFYAPALIPPDRPVAELLREHREGLIADLGGREACSTAKLALVDLIVTAWWQLESVSAYLMTLSSLVDRRHRRVWQVVRGNYNAGTGAYRNSNGRTCFGRGAARVCN